MRRTLLWLPVLFIAAVLYWTVALGLGGLSFLALADMDRERVIDAESARLARPGCVPVRRPHGDWVELHEPIEIDLRADVAE